MLSTHQDHLFLRLAKAICLAVWNQLISCFISILINGLNYSLGETWGQLTIQVSLMDLYYFALIYQISLQIAISRQFPYHSYFNQLNQPQTVSFHLSMELSSQTDYYYSQYHLTKFIFAILYYYLMEVFQTLSEKTDFQFIQEVIIDQVIIKVVAVIAFFDDIHYPLLFLTII